MTEQFGLNAADIALIVGATQCGLIAWGINQMRRSNESRDVVLKSLDQHAQALDRQLAASDQHSRALERLLERTA